MDETYGVYCLADPVFYDAPALARDDDPDFDLGRRAVPHGWRRSELEDWLVCTPAGAPLPPQGWKVHVSACLDNAEEILETASAYFLEREIAFKFVRSKQLLLIANSKYADRGSSGKFITAYPRDGAELERIVTELGALLDGQPGPYILSDLRIGDGPLY